MSDVVWDPDPDLSLEREPSPAPSRAVGADVWPAMGIEVSADRSRTWVARAAERKGRVVLELLEPLPGPAAGTVVSTVAGWRTEWRVGSVGIDPRSPSASLVAPLKAAKVPTTAADAHGMAVAHGTFLDLLTGGRLRTRGHAALDTAVRQAQERRVAGAAGLDRYQGVDPAPLVAAELCCWVLLAVPKHPPAQIF
jgi:hypothetical protein